MAFIPLPAGLKVELKFTLAGELVVNVYHVTTELPLVSANLTNIAEAFITAWIADAAGVLSSEITLDEVIVTDVSVEDGLQVTVTTDLPAAGEVVQQSLPNNVALVISNRSDLTGRSRRGRTYIAGIPETAVQVNIVDVVTAGGLLTYHANLRTDLDVNHNTTLGVASYVSDGAPRTTALFTPFTNFIVNTRIDSQRRRLPGVGA